MKGVLIVGHGSRQVSAGQILESIADATRTRLPGILIDIAYMEFSAQDIPFGLNRLISQGAHEIAVVPYFLFDGIHIRENIPQAVEKFRQANPDIIISIGRPLGADERLAQILADRARECL